MELLQSSETSKEDQRLMKVAAKWLKRIEREKEHHEDYRDSAVDAWAVYLDDIDRHEIYVPLLWNVVQVQHSAIYSRQPTPDCRPRNSENNPTTKQAARVMQRALEFYLDQTLFHDNYDRVVDDYLVSGLGVARVKIDAEIVEVDATDEMGAPVIDIETGESMTEPVITEQVIRIEHIPAARFGWEPCTNWDHCEWVYFEHHLTKAEVKRRWPDATLAPDESKTDSEVRHRTKPEKRNTSTVYEVWDKRNKEVIIVAKGNSTPLEVMDDPLGLENFFPCPKPMFLNLPTDDLIPTTDYTYMRSTDDELNRLYKRARGITEQIKATSLHDASMVEIPDWKGVGDGDSIPIENATERLDGKDLSNVIYFWPLQERMLTLEAITKQIQIKRQHVDDMMGISDILRGGSNPQDGQETQKIKERWAGIRLRRKQVAVQLQIRDIFRMMAELTVEHVTLDNLSKMTQMQITPDVYGMLRNDLMREYSIEVETDSTVAMDEFGERRERTELLQAITQYVSVVAPAMQQNVIPADLGREILQVATDPYKKFSRGLDDVIETLPTTQKQLQKQGQQTKQMGQQLSQMQQQIQQMQYALNQYSQAEEQRKTQESAAKAAKDMMTAEKTKAQIPDESIQPQKTMAEVQKLGAETVDIMRPDNV